MVAVEGGGAMMMLFAEDGRCATQSILTLALSLTHIFQKCKNICETKRRFALRQSPTENADALPKKPLLLTNHTASSLGLWYHHYLLTTPLACQQ